jgi:hypothetical protein
MKGRPGDLVAAADKDAEVVILEFCVVTSTLFWLRIREDWEIK